MSLHVVFRTDASIHIGQGHVMRCLALAEQLRRHDATCSFISATLPGNLINTVLNRGFAVDTINVFDRSHWMQDAAESAATLGNEPVDWIVVDHYGLDFQWERVLKDRVAHLMVIDDLADRQHHCDLLLDQNPGRQAQDYRPRVDLACQLLLGPDYALLREEFSQRRIGRKSVRNDPIKKLLISLGGTDANNVTAQVISVLENSALPRLAEIKIILSAQAPWLEAVRKQALASHLPIDVIVSPQNISDILSDADLAIGAAGVSALERCCIGLPSLLVVTADNQRSGATALHAMGAAHCLGSLDEFEIHLRDFFQHHPTASYWQAMSTRGQEIVDGEGCARVAFLMSQSATQPQRYASVALAAASSSSGRLRPVGTSDLSMIFAWRNHPDVRRFMRNTCVLEWSEHLNWFRRKSTSGNSLFIFEIDGTPLGFVQLDTTDNPEVVEWGFYAAPDAPKGMGQRLGKAAISQVFQCNKVERIIGQVLVDNLRSQRFHERLGFHRLVQTPAEASSTEIPLISYSLSRSDWFGMQARRQGELHECHD